MMGEPKSKGRPRFTRQGHAYTPKETREAEVAVLLAWELSGGQVLNGPLVIKCEFYVGTKRRKDTDNMLKLILDALNRKAFADDDQIVRIDAVKRYTTPGKARTVVKIFQEMEVVYE